MSKRRVNIDMRLFICSIVLCVYILRKGRKQNLFISRINLYEGRKQNLFISRINLYAEMCFDRKREKYNLWEIKDDFCVFQ